MIEVREMGKGKARERRQARTREAIIQAAEQIIETRGPDALNMRDVAELIDYSASNLYEYFASKDELLAAVANEALTRLAMQIRQSARALSSRERLLAYGRSYLEFARTHAQLYLLTFGRKLAHCVLSNPEQAPSSYNFLLQIVKEGIESGVFVRRPDFDLHEMTFGCWSLVHGIAMLHLTTQDVPWETVSAADQQILECFADGLSRG
jgi:AcrR family transcriptional regulator